MCNPIKQRIYSKPGKKNRCKFPGDCHTLVGYVGGVKCDAEVREKVRKRVLVTVHTCTETSNFFP